jgi:hypothetical protein
VHASAIVAAMQVESGRGKRRRIMRAILRIGRKLPN